MKINPSFAVQFSAESNSASPGTSFPLQILALPSVFLCAKGKDLVPFFAVNSHLHKQRWQQQSAEKLIYKPLNHQFRVTLQSQDMQIKVVC